MKAYIKLEPPYEWAKVDGKTVTSFGEVSSLAEYPLSDESEIIGVVPGEEVTVHRVSIPAKSKKQFMLALPFSLEEVLSDDVENMHFICPNWKAGEECHVLVVAKERMRAWQQSANVNRLSIEQLLPDHVLLPFHDVAEYSLALSSDRLLANNVDGFSASLDADFLDIWLMDVPINSTIAINDQQLTETLIAKNPDRDFRHWPFGDKMVHWLEYMPESKLDLWTDQFRPSVKNLNLKSFLLPVLIVFAAIFTKFSFDTYRYFSLHAEIRSLNSQMQNVVKSTFPQIDFIETGKERFMMSEAIKRIGGTSQVRNAQTMLASVAQVLKPQRVEIIDMSYRDERLEVTCKLNNFSQVDLITKKLNAQKKIKANLESSSSDEGSIVASFTIENS